MSKKLEMIKKLVEACDQACEALGDAGVYDQRPYGWFGDNGLRAQAIEIIGQPDPLSAKYLELLTYIAECIECDDVQAVQAFPARVKEIVEQNKAGE